MRCDAAQVTCNEGIRCPFASSIDALRSGTSPLGDRFLPTIQRGTFWDGGRGAASDEHVAVGHGYDLKVGKMGKMGKGLSFLMEG